MPSRPDRCGRARPTFRKSDFHALHYSSSALRSAFDELSLGHIPTSLSSRVPQMGGLHVQLMGDIVKLLVIGMQEWEDAKCEI